MLVAREAAHVYAHNFLSIEDHSFTFRERLHTARQFKIVFNRATKLSSEMFTLLSTVNKAGYPRIGIIVAKRKAKRAIDRNLIKRIVRESFRNNKTKLAARDYVVVLKQPVLKTRVSLQRNILRQQLEDLWQLSATSQ